MKVNLMQDTKTQSNSMIAAILLVVFAAVFGAGAAVSMFIFVLILTVSIWTAIILLAPSMVILIIELMKGHDIDFIFNQIVNLYKLVFSYIFFFF